MKLNQRIPHSGQRKKKEEALKNIKQVIINQACVRWQTCPFRESAIYIDFRASLSVGFQLASFFGSRAWMSPPSHESRGYGSI